jgi:S1-C subfamily serine protease
MRLRKAVAFVILAALVPAGCATQTDVYGAFAKIDHAWKEENDRLLAANGKRSVAASKYQSFLATQQALRRLGLVVRNAELATGYIYAIGPAPAPLDGREWESVRTQETPRLRRIVTDELGVIGHFATLNSMSYDILTNAYVQETSAGADVSVTFAMQNKSPSLRAIGSQPPPSAVKIGLDKFWAAVDTELKAVLANKAIPSSPSPPTAAAPGTQEPPPPATPEQRGSGFIVSRSGAVMTNFHVIEGCSRFAVRKPGEEVMRARYVASDPANDLAVLRIPASQSLAVAKFRDGQPIRQGDGIVAMGFPLHGLLASQANLSVGHVSALAGLGNDSTRLQISAPIQPGNSGGPLLDMDGHVVGVVVSTLSALRMANITGTVPQNVNFAIKADIARNFLGSNGVPYELAKSTRQLGAGDVGDLARPYTVLVECWK